ncbi:hypothetical protein WMC53_08865 [Halorubrum ezzemoulense]|nr:MULTISPECIES: hypothetical protein [Halorubrum]MDB9235386.1 hypothetical protein [Halorubrum ezzemoulense]
MNFERRTFVKGVAGLAALVRELEPNANASRIEQAIQKGAEGANGKSDSEFGAGIINALNTVERLGSGKGKGNGN